jgi:hypothetical protein
MPEHSKEPRADRTVACVKALAGVKDPEKLMAAVREFVKTRACHEFNEHEDWLDEIELRLGEE